MPEAGRSKLMLVTAALLAKQREALRRVISFRLSVNSYPSLHNEIQRPALNNFGKLSTGLLKVINIYLKF